MNDEPHWLIKDFNALYRAALALAEACRGRGECRPSPAMLEHLRSQLRALEAQLERLRPAFEATEAERGSKR